MATHSRHRSAAHRPLWLNVAITGTTLALLVASGTLALRALGSDTGGGSSASAAQLAASVPPFDIVSTSPSSGATNVAPDTTITVTLSSPVGADSPWPTLSPPMLGSWQATTPTTLTFTPSGSFVPSTPVTLTIPGGKGGMVGAQGQRLASGETVQFTIAPGSELRLQQLLAELGYLPVSFTPTNPVPVPANEQALPQPGTFSWRWSTLPTSLQSLWVPGQPNVITTGAVMAFEDNSQLTTDGIPGPQVWTALLQAIAAGRTDPQPYDYVYVSKVLPETVTVWRDGAIAFTTLANTGIPASPTPNGTWPVYLRYRSQTMSGVNPDGTHYSDPGIPWISYFYESDALHGFIRASYGFPQSLGCVEMPFSSAAVVWPLTPIGTLVTVQ